MIEKLHKSFGQLKKVFKIKIEKNEVSYSIPTWDSQAVNSRKCILPQMTELELVFERDILAKTN